jgi:hypothetical protein
MSVFADLSTLFDVVRALPIDDSSISVLAMLIGIAGGWAVTGLHQQMKAKRVKLEAQKRQQRFRKPD